MHSKLQHKFMNRSISANLQCAICSTPMQLHLIYSLPSLPILPSAPVVQGSICTLNIFEVRMHQSCQRSYSGIASEHTAQNRQQQYSSTSPHPELNAPAPIMQSQPSTTYTLQVLSSFMSQPAPPKGKLQSRRQRFRRQKLLPFVPVGAPAVSFRAAGGS